MSNEDSNKKTEDQSSSFDISQIPQHLKTEFNKMLELINITPFLQSVLYDLNLLPEQIKTKDDFRKLALIVENYDNFILKSK